MAWHCVEISESYVLGGTFHQLCRDFQRAFMAAGGPAEMALFAQTEPEEDIRRVFFSPGSSAHVQDLIDKHQGFFCSRPDAQNVTLLFGIPDAFASLFSAADTSEYAAQASPAA